MAPLSEPPPAVPDHELLRRIGAGAYGEVWLARTVLGELRAVKVIRRDAFGDDPRPFDREFEGIRRFEPISRSDPSQLAILHVGRAADDSYFYYVMELADEAEPGGIDPCSVISSPSEAPMPSIPALKTGSLNTDRLITDYSPRTLRSDLRPGTCLPVARVVELGLALTQALAHLHRQGLVHRDVKPSNIIFVGGRPKLADIGLVTQAVAGNDARSIVGTEGYLAPEGPGTAQADLYALGKVLYEAAMGRDRRDFPDLPLGWPDVPERAALLELNEVIVKACAADARERYASAEAMLTDIKLLDAGKSVKRRRTWQQTRRVVLQAGLVAAVSVAGWLLLPRFIDQPATASAPASVFILPFRKDGTNGNDGELAGRMTDAFINSLKLIDGVTVAARRSALADRPLAEARAEAARRFGVRYVLTGRLRSGDALKLSLDLLETGRELPVWSQTFNETTNRLIELEDQAIRAVAVALNTPISSDASPRIGKVLTNNLTAWKLVEQGVQAFFLETRAGFDTALQRYNEALDLDRDYLEAWSRKAQLYRELVVDDHPRRVWPEVKACAERMLQLDPTSGAGQYYRWGAQVIFDWDWIGGEASFHERRARGADGPVVTALYLRMLGRTNEARIEQAKVAHLDQTDTYVRNHIVAAFFVERDYQRVLEEADKTEAFMARPGIAGNWRFHAHYQLDQFQQALDAIRAYRKLRDAPALMAMEACALAKLGERDPAVKILGDLEAMPGFGRYVDPYPLAWIHLALGDKPAALAKLRQACLDKSEWVVFTDEPGGLRTDPKLDELRDEPEFQELLKLAGLDVWPK